MTEDDRQKLSLVHPRIREALYRILPAMETFGHPMTVFEGVRSPGRQAALYAQGRTRPGKIVTNVDGLDPSKCTHFAQADGFGHAVDCVFLVDGGPSWDPNLPWQVYGAMVRALGLTWGGDWPHLRDFPHLEIPV